MIDQSNAVYKSLCINRWFSNLKFVNSDLFNVDDWLFKMTTELSTYRDQHFKGTRTDQVGNFDYFTRDSVKMATNFTWSNRITKAADPS